MSEIFNLVILKDNNIEKIYIFKGVTDDNYETNSEIMNYIETNNIPYDIIDQEIYNDDSIIKIKQKIVKYLDLNISLHELYLFKLQNHSIQPDLLYQQLTVNDYLKLNESRINNFLKNIHDKDIFHNDSLDLNTIKPYKKSLYLYSDLLKLNKIDYNDIKLKTPLGIDVNYNNNKYPFVVNPYDITDIDKFIQEEHAKPSTIQKPVLLTTGPILNNCIYLCKCEDVLNYHKNNGDINDEYILKLYYPLIFKKQIKNSSMLIENKNRLLDETERMIDTVENKDFKLRKLNEIILKKSIHFDKYGVYGIYITIYQPVVMKISIEDIFKVFHSNENVLLVKLNAGKNSENVYRLYTKNYKSEEGLKIPVLHAEYSRQHGSLKIDRIAQSISKKTGIGFFIKYDIHEIYCELFENGNIEVKIEFADLISIPNVENLIKKVLNKYIFDNLNAYTNQIGYTFINFESFKSSNISINSLNYSFILDYQKK